MSLTLEQLSNEYEQSIITQQGVIEAYRIKLNKALKESNYKEIHRLNRLLRILYEEQDELREDAYHLKKYCS